MLFHQEGQYICFGAVSQISLGWSSFHCCLSPGIEIRDQLTPGSFTKVRLVLIAYIICSIVRAIFFFSNSPVMLPNVNPSGVPADAAGCCSVAGWDSVCLCQAPDQGADLGSQGTDLGSQREMGRTSSGTSGTNQA